MDHKRRNFIQTTIAASLGIPLMGSNLISDSLLKDQKIKISLQCYSFASSLFTKKMNIITLFIGIYLIPYIIHMKD